MKRTTLKLQGFPVDTFSIEEALEYALDTHGQVVTINPEMIALAKKNEEFAKVINEAELIIPDGIGVEIGLKILGHNVHRIAGIEFADKLIQICVQNHKTVALVGAKPEIIQKTVENFKIKNSEINIVYYRDGYFTEEENEQVINDIIAAKPDLLLTALGAPKQEFFNRRIKDILPETLCVGVGGSFDVWSGEVKRAPVIWRKLGLEWLYRTVKEPARFKRIFPVLPLFIINVFRERVLRNA